MPKVTFNGTPDIGKMMEYMSELLSMQYGAKITLTAVPKEQDDTEKKGIT